MYVLYFLVALIASALMMTTLIIALRLTGDAGFLRNWWLWFFTLGFIGWGPVLYVVFWRWLGGVTHGDVVSTYVFLLAVSAMATLMLTVVLESFDVAALATGVAFAVCAIGMNVTALFAGEPVPAPFSMVTAFSAPVAWNSGLAAVMIPKALRARTVNVRAANRQCWECGYDLKTVLRSHLCPECGEPFREPRDGDLPHQGAL